MIPTIYTTNETKQQTHKENYHLYFIEPKITIKKNKWWKKEWIDVTKSSSHTTKKNWNFFWRSKIIHEPYGDKHNIIIIYIDIYEKTVPKYINKKLASFEKHWFLLLVVVVRARIMFFFWKRLIYSWFVFLLLYCYILLFHINFKFFSFPFFWNPCVCF